MEWIGYESSHEKTDIYRKFCAHLIVVLAPNMAPVVSEPRSAPHVVVVVVVVVFCCCWEIRDNFVEKSVHAENKI